MPNAPVNEIHPFNVGIKRQTSNTSAGTKTIEAKNPIAPKRSKSQNSKNSKKTKQHAGDEDEDISNMMGEASNSNGLDSTDNKLLNEHAESSSGEEKSGNKMDEILSAAVESSRTDSIDSTSSMMNQNLESVRESLHSLSTTPSNNTPTHFSHNE